MARPQTDLDGGRAELLALMVGLIEAVAEHWFQPKVEIMEEVVASELSPRRKMYEFYARRFALMKEIGRAHV